MNRKSRKKEALTPYERRKRRLEKRFSTAPKTTGQKVAGAVIDNICWIVGCSLYSIGVVAFALPNSIAQSGTTGLAIIVNHLFEFIPLGTANFLLNVPLMILAFIFIGWRFVAKTMWVTVILSATLDLFSKFFADLYGRQDFGGNILRRLHGRGAGDCLHARRDYWRHRYRRSSRPQGVPAHSDRQGHYGCRCDNSYPRRGRFPLHRVRYVRGYSYFRQFPPARLYSLRHRQRQAAARRD